jgi:katanin p60 ATPase-containing subunit A1
MDRDLARALAMFDNEFGRLSFGPTRRESPLMPARRGSTDARRNPIPWGAPARREGRPWDAPPARRNDGGRQRTPSGYRGRLAKEGILPADATPKRSSTGRKRPNSKGDAKEARADSSKGDAKEPRAAPPEKRSPRAPAEPKPKPTDPFSRLVEDEMLLNEETTRWEDVGGLEATKQLLTEAAVLPMLIPGFFTGVRTPWRGVLLFGPPGTGKTLLARAVAAQARAAFFSVSPSSLLSKFVGESEKVAKAVYDCARARAPAVVFFDEIDALASRRGASTEHEASRRLKTELLTQIDGITTGASVLTLATSSPVWKSNFRRPTFVL